MGLKIENLCTVAGKVAVVTGGSSGISRRVAAALVANATRVYIVGRKAGALEQAATELSADGGICIPIIGDLSLPDEPARIAALLREREEGIDFQIGRAHV